MQSLCYSEVLQVLERRLMPHHDAREKAEVVSPHLLSRSLTPLSSAHTSDGCTFPLSCHSLYLSSLNFPLPYPVPARQAHERGEAVLRSGPLPSLMSDAVAMQKGGLLVSMSTRRLSKMLKVALIHLNWLYKLAGVSGGTYTLRPSAKPCKGQGQHMLCEGLYSNGAVERLQPILTLNHLNHTSCLSTPISSDPLALSACPRHLSAGGGAAEQ